MFMFLLLHTQLLASQGCKVFIFIFCNRRYSLLSFGRPQLYNSEAMPFTYDSVLDAATSSVILKAKQKLGVTFNSDRQDIIDFTKISKMTMCRASEAIS